MILLPFERPRDDLLEAVCRELCYCVLGIEVLHLIKTMRTSMKSLLPDTLQIISGTYTLINLSAKIEKSLGY